MKLTIAIPTFNRHENLKNTLVRLLPQVTDQCMLLIIDNHSDVPVASWAEEFIGNYPDVSWRIIRNRINVGGNSNILRCFEYCESDWLWTLGDDDEITQDAIATIFEDISLHNSCMNINYYSPHKLHVVRKELKVFQGKSQFIESIDFFGASIYMSANVYNVSKLKDHWVANDNTSSCAAHWLILYKNISEKDHVIVSNKIICYNVFERTEYSPASLYIIRGFATLFDLIESKTEKDILIKKFAYVAENWLTFDKTMMYLLIEYIRSNKTTDILFFFKRFYTSFYSLFGLKYAFKYYVFYSILLLSPTLAFALVRQIILRKKSIDIGDFV